MSEFEGVAVKPDPTCTHGGFGIVCVPGAFACGGCGRRFVYESVLKDVAHAEHEAKRQLKEMGLGYALAHKQREERLTRLEEAHALVRKLAGALLSFRHAGEEGGYPPGFFHSCQSGETCLRCRAGLDALAAVPEELKP
jgi:hypothetical protein